MKETRPTLPRRNLTREIKPPYWRKLIEAGVPIDAADAIAWAIARYDTARRLPPVYSKAGDFMGNPAIARYNTARRLSPSSQQALIRQYCAFV
jgi:hypothetical protein